MFEGKVINEYDSEDNDYLLDDETKRKKFIFRFVNSLHGAGNFSFRTEKFINRIAYSFGLNCNCCILPVTAILSFSDSTPQLNASSNESYTIPIKYDLNCNKLELLDQLASEIWNFQIDFDTADKRLQSIENLSELYPWYITALSYGFASFGSTLLFFGGTWTDGCCSFVCGLIVYSISLLSTRLKGLAEIEGFFTACIVAMLGSYLDRYVYNSELCLYGQLFGGIVILLPGLTIAISLLEVNSKMIVYGSSRLVYGITLAVQLGFGLAVGYKIINSDSNLSIPVSFSTGCRDPVEPYFGFLLLPIASISFGITLNANWKQFPGMVFTAGIGQLTSWYLTEIELGTEVIPFISAVNITAFARLYSIVLGNKRSIIYVIAGLLVLVPGSLGVKGMSSMWAGENTSNGLEFTFKMFTIGVTLSIGVFLALLPRKSWLLNSKNKKNRRKYSTATYCDGTVLLNPSMPIIHKIFQN